MLLAGLMFYDTTATPQICSDETTTLYEKEALQNATEAMLTGYLGSCEVGTATSCQVSEDAVKSLGEFMALATKIGISTPEDVNTVDPQQALGVLMAEYTANPPSLVGALDADVSTFKADPTYTAYISECKAAGGKSELVDITLNAEGVAYDTIAKGIGLEGLKTDIDISIDSFPMCVTSACDGEDLTAVAEAVFFGALAEVEQASALPPGMDSFKDICDTSGLGKCEIEAERTSENSGPSTDPNGGTETSGANLIGVTSISAVAAIFGASLMV